MTKFMSKSNNCNQSAIIFRIILCSGISLVLGAVLGHLLRTELIADINAEFEQILLALDTKSIHYPSLFRLCTSTQFKQLFLLCFFSLTNAWVFYLTFYCLYTGFRCGLLLSFCLTHNVHSGFFDFLCFLLPHCLLYIPAYLLQHIDEQQIRRYIQQAVRQQKAKKQSLLQGLPILLLSICLLFAGCLCEAFINPSLMQWYQGL